MKWDDETVESFRRAARKDDPDSVQAYRESLNAMRGLLVGIVLMAPLYLLSLWALWSYVSS